MATAIALPKGRVTKIGDKYFVQQQNSDQTWKTIGNEYKHQTSAYAALGRLYERAE